MKRWLECYQAYLKEDYKEIPDFDPETGMANHDWLCIACPTWIFRCQNLKLPENRSKIKW